MPRLVRNAVVILVVAVAAAALWVLWVFFGPNTFDAPQKTFLVSRGQTFSAIVDSLEAHGIIRDKGLFTFVVKLHGGTTRLQVGKYTFHSGISNYTLFVSLKTGRGSVLTQVTLPEGLTARSQARILSRALGIDSARYVSLAHDPEFARSLDIEAPSLEGYLFPETYSFPWQPDEREIQRRMVEQFRKFFTDSLVERTKDLGLTENSVLTMASIVEGEARLNIERPVIAGVYYNRLRKGMRLEADPTVAYILPDGPRRIYYGDLQRESPYNTYRNKGLPPGPVNNPGKESILAALYPVHHDYLFFVANGKGGHWFTSTFDEHLRYVRLARRQRAARSQG